ncbi:MAG: M43 family zinc metalloprotease [Saprospiraceae bacterium]
MRHLFILLMLLNAIQSEAQIRHCGNDAFQHPFREFKKNVRKLGPPIFDREPITIAIVVHVVWHNPEENLCDEAIFAQIKALNRDFSGQNLDGDLVPSEFEAIKSGDTGIRFCLASIDPAGRSTTGIVRVKTPFAEAGLSDSLYNSDRGGSSAWDVERYLNLWVANTGKFIAGFGTYPSFVAPEKSGVVIHPKYFGTHANGRFNLGRTTVHEVGHYLGLLHPWDGDNCGIADSIADTPPQSHAYEGCPDYPQYSCGNSIAFMNYMDYVDDACMVMFTQGQKAIMLSTLETLRPHLINNQTTACLSPLSPKFDFEIYPIPARQEIFIRTQNPLIAEAYSIEILNPFGQKVSILQCIKSNSEIQIEVNSLTPGIYFVRIGKLAKAFVRM